MLGWSDLALFSIYKNLHISVDQVYILLGVQYKKTAISAAPAPKFSLTKIGDTLKIHFLCGQFEKNLSYTSKSNCQTEHYKFKKIRIFFFFS